MYRHSSSTNRLIVVLITPRPGVCLGGPPVLVVRQYPGKGSWFTDQGPIETKSVLCKTGGGSEIPGRASWEWKVVQAHVYRVVQPLGVEDRACPRRHLHVGPPEPLPSRVAALSVPRSVPAPVRCEADEPVSRRRARGGGRGRPVGTRRPPHVRAPAGGSEASATTSGGWRRPARLGLSGHLLSLRGPSDVHFGPDPTVPTVVSYPPTLGPDCLCPSRRP